MEKRGPWGINGSKVVYKNPWISVRQDEVVRPDGKEGIFGVVTIGAGCSVIALDEEGNVFLTEEYHYAVERVTIEAASGGMDTGETPLDAGKRELKEETGLTAETWTYLGVVDPLTQVVTAPIHIYLAEDLTQGPPHQEGTETIQVIKVPLLTALKWVNESKITHSGTVVALLKIGNIVAQRKR